MSDFVFNCYSVAFDHLASLLNRTLYEVVSVVVSPADFGRGNDYTIIQRARTETQLTGSLQAPTGAIGPNPHAIDSWYRADGQAGNHVFHLLPVSSWHYVQEYLSRARYEVVAIVTLPARFGAGAYGIIQRALAQTLVLDGLSQPVTQAGPDPAHTDRWYLPNAEHIAHLGSA